ncbi:glucosaminidase domain-containing protein [Thiomicrospira sp. R3]|uniref:glucosaminidase domain-containing protein n=1 Tax=Thiomicrospira sp. R3 TaxID=3035472 RepID=UPI00259BA9D4|nr:glucosaminidase domain-containing protein [Thiomicrospira sp. R3]WFE68015.1 glucosaminidase domain-containing protein [Thiomicrospira sp. R3]
MERYLKIILTVLVFVALWIFMERDSCDQQCESLHKELSELRSADDGVSKSEKTKTKLTSIEIKPKPVGQAIPDFAAIKDVNQRKQAFVEFMLPAIHASNKAILLERAFLKSLNLNRMNANQRRKFEALAQKYQQPREKGQSFEDWHAELLKKVDIIPPALALAQAANESAWGTSRFALEGLNFFGHWCFSVGCGLIPERRPEGQTYEVRVFNSVEDSVAAYMLNLNAFYSYETLRNLRQELRQSGAGLNSKLLAYGLIDYSAKREEYIRELQVMIRFNRWQKYDNESKR